jgi:hypothetical protein
MWLWIIFGTVVAVALVIGALADRRSRRLRGSVPELRMSSRSERLNDAAKYGDVHQQFGGGPS